MITHIVVKTQRSKVSLFEFQFVNSTISTSVNQYTSKVSHTTSAYFSMMTSSHGNIFRVTGHLCGEFNGPGEFPTNKGQWRGALMFFFDLRLNKRLSKQPWGWWYEALSRPLWRHRNATFDRNSSFTSQTVKLIILEFGNYIYCR